MRVGRSRMYCNTGSTRGGCGASTTYPPGSKNQFNILGVIWPRIRY